MLTGEPEPEPLTIGGRAFAGTMNLTGPLILTVTAKAADTLLAEIVRLMEAAERTASPYVRLADRASRLYAPFVHLLALATLAGWLAAGGGWHMALTASVAVLIITCPCALGLAVPAVQVVAGGYLFGRGVMVKDGGALERLAVADTVVLDKTGTLTEGEPRLVDCPDLTGDEWSLVAALGESSRHPLARALAGAAGQRGHPPVTLESIVELPGEGVSAILHGTPVRLGRREWLGCPDENLRAALSEVWLRIGNRPALRFGFEDALRADAGQTVERLKRAGLDTILLSGDREDAVIAVAGRVGIDQWRAEQRPADKAAFLEELALRGKRVLMVGDGINDAPALATAFVSISPSSAADISQTAADVVFTGNKLAPVALALKVARTAHRLILQNFALAIGYNLIAVPVAVLGYATPLIAAVAMSASSIAVTANALRLRLAMRRRSGRRPLDPTGVRLRAETPA
jgi:Cu2+-exporting ATPase